MVTRAPDLRQQVFDALRERIRSGYYELDQRILEKDICEDFGVSRTPVREALAQLSRDGFLVQDRRGYRIPKVSVTDIEEVFEVRLCLEPYAVRRVAETVTDAELATLKDLVQAAYDSAGDAAAYMEAHRAFRDALYGLVKNKRLRQQIFQFEDHVVLVRSKTLMNAEARRISAEGQMKLFEAVAARDADRSEAAVRFLLTEARRVLIEVMKSDPE